MSAPNPSAASDASEDELDYRTACVPVRNWQQGKRKPAGANFVLLRVAEKHPEALLDAVMA